MNIQTLRRSIDRIDTQILRLLNQRVRLAHQIGQLKRQLGNRQVDPRRERQILARLRRRNRGPLTQRAVRAVYTQIFRQTRAIQRRAR